MRETRSGLTDADHSRPGRTATLRRGLLVGVFVLQFLIPLVVLVASPAPSRFGFQMYSGQGDVHAYVIDSSGHRTSIDFDDLVANGRTEIDWISKLHQDYVCHTLPRAAKVVVSQVNSRGTRTARFTCDRN
ncbi:hypothetical protein ASE12_16840 [Aeromicrobium sp. Root236]|nr:hypothetical protein ASE12_16840 [Aeromicrobium sp. Root236]